MMEPRHLSVLFSKAAPAVLAPVLPQVWLISDARNDAVLEAALARLPRGGGFIFRHYHLAEPARLVRFNALARAARKVGHRVILAGTPAAARRAGADGAYGPAQRLAGASLAGASLARGGAGLRLVTAHSLREIAAAHRARADAILLSPVWPTRSHAGAKGLGRSRFRLLAARALVPVIALGGMSGKRARAMRWPRWAAIDGLSASIMAGAQGDC